MEAPRGYSLIMLIRQFLNSSVIKKTKESSRMSQNSIKNPLSLLNIISKLTPLNFEKQKKKENFFEPPCKFLKTKKLF